jgi:hypothetical protein
MKSSLIIAEELKKAGVVLEEEALEQVEQVFAHKIIPRLALEADESAVKMIAGGMMLVLPALEPALEKAMDRNHDGKVGAV